MADPHEILDTMLSEQPSKDQDDVPHPAEYADDALALRFSAVHGDDLRFVNLWNRWLRWDGARWDVDDTLHVFDLARVVARQASAEILQAGGHRQLAGSVASGRTVAAIEKLARADRRHATSSDVWDRDHWLLNTPKGTVDLRTGELRPHARDDLITKVTAVGTEGDCPLWLGFLERVFNGDRDLIDYVQRVVGYSLTGSIEDHALFFLYGSGGNGKSVLLDALQEIMGDYASVASMEAFVASRNERHSTDLAMLRGARVVIAQETEGGQYWAEARVKRLTGGGKISARFMKQDNFTFKPTFKLVIAGNHRPSLRNVDEAIRRRLHLIPFTVTISAEERDPKLSEKLQAEWPGILAWAIEGCLEWQRIGLAPPSAVRMATEAYLADEDALGRFLDEQCETAGLEVIEEVKLLFAAWTAWCAGTNDFAGTVRQFSQKMEGRGLERVRHPQHRRMCFRGVKLIAPEDCQGGEDVG